MAAPQPAAAARGQKLPCFLRPNRPDPRRRRDEGTAQPRRTPLLAAQPRRGRWRRPPSLPCQVRNLSRRRGTRGDGAAAQERCRRGEKQPCRCCEEKAREGNRARPCSPAAGPAPMVIPIRCSYKIPTSLARFSLLEFDMPIYVGHKSNI